MMNAVRILTVMIVMTAVPLWVGMLFPPPEEKGAGLPFCWISGQVLLWAGFQIMCVPAILTGRTFGEMEKAFFCYVGVLALSAGIAVFLRRRKVTARPGTGQEARQKRGAEQNFRQEASSESGIGESSQKSKVRLALWAGFALLLGIQLFLLCYLAYDEGDDAYYVAIAANANPDSKMYSIHPYTGSGTELDVRHALAPLPVWVSVISRLSGLSGAATAHVALPLILVPMTYCLYYLLGKKLIGGDGARGGWEMPLFMCFAALLVLFGGYSTFSAENFLLVRGAQGKSVLANLIIPFLFYEVFGLLEKLDRGEKMNFPSWILVGLTMIAGCLCSTLGSLLLCILLGISAVCAGLAYRRWSVFIGAALCMAAPVLFACLYVLCGES